MQRGPEDSRLDRLVDLVVQIASGDLSARLQPSPAGDSIDGVIVGVNMLAEELHVSYSDLERRVAERTAQLEQAQQELHRMALTDALTGLANRTLLNDRIEQALTRTRRGAAPPTLVLLDLDGFKSINDRRGHAVGDAVLVAVAQRLQKVARETDTVARVGGDEFAVLILDTTPDDALKIAERALRALRPPIQDGDQVSSVGASIGVRFGSLNQTAHELLRDADTAMYAAKARGRNNVQIFAPAMHTAALSRKSVAQELRSALHTNQLTLHYQPLVELTSGRIIGVEALARWQHPHRGAVPPGEFVPLAEETGLMGDLGNRVILTAVQELATWNARLVLPAAFRVHVNTSPVQFQEGDLTGTVRRAMQQHDVSASRLVLEMTETGLTSLDAAGARTLADLRAAGVALALDGFGAGCSSIGQLRRLAVDTVKVDRSLMENLEVDHQHRHLVQAIVQLVDALGLTAVAVGVENGGQATQLRGLGCKLAQGYYFSRPVPADQMLELLRADQSRHVLPRDDAAGHHLHTAQP